MRDSAVTLPQLNWDSNSMSENQSNIQINTKWLTEYGFRQNRVKSGEMKSFVSVFDHF